ncbi:MAG: hypothetical protein ACXWDN_05930 [Limisphaerales bacterium]
MPGLAAVEAEWRGFLGIDLERFKKEFLQESGRMARSYPCPNECGYDHTVRKREDGTFIGVQHGEAACKDLILTAQDVAVWELKVNRLGQAVMAALGGQGQCGAAGVAGMWELGTVAGSNVPVILCLHERADEFCGAVAEIVGRLRDRFLLVAPTNRFFNIATRDLLKNVSAEFVDLETHFALFKKGGLKAGKVALQVIGRLQKSPGDETHTKPVGGAKSRHGQLEQENDFNDIVFRGERYDLRKRSKARFCIKLLVTKQAFNPATAVHFDREINPYVVKMTSLPNLPNVKIHHYFTDARGKLSKLRKELVKAAGKNGKFYLHVE